MTTKELSNEFDILYDSIASLGAPGLDEYEKSVFLTKAQLEVIKELNGNLNKYGTSFEGSDKRRADLRELLVNTSITPSKIGTAKGIIKYTVQVPANLFLIKYEAASFTSVGCTEPQEMEIIPIKYDEFHTHKRNPFRKPNYQKGFRLDLASNINGKAVELYTDREITIYHMTYLKYPTPIILTDLEGISGDPTLSVDGVKIKTECALDQELHREILDRAVQLAMLSYKGEALPSKVQLDQRNN